MEMNLLMHLLCTFTIVASANKNQDEKCPYGSTVDLTNQTTFSNGSYAYQGVLIPPDEQSFYNYHSLFGDETVVAPVHLRGCVCDKHKACIKLCCDKNEIFNADTFKCEKISEDFKVSWDLTIRLTNNLYKMVNVLQHFTYQVGVPCSIPELLIMNFEKWVLLENGTISKGNEYLPLDTMNYCLTLQRSNKSDEYLLTPLSCSIETYEPGNRTLISYAMAVSVLFLIFTIAVYLIVKELRRNLSGKILICYLLSMVMAYSIICFINISRVVFKYLTCCLLGYSCYFFFIATFMWLSVLCYDIWSSFMVHLNAVQARENTKRFLYYSLYAWGWSTIFTLFTLWAELSPNVAELYKPGIGIEMCWINTNKWSAAIYFYGLNLIILVFNIITFIFVTVHIYSVRRNSAKIINKDHSFHANSMIIFRLIFVMGVSWIFDIFSYMLPQTNKWQLIFTISDLLNALQGPLIFALFVCKRDVLSLLKTRFITCICKPRRCNSLEILEIYNLQIHANPSHD